MKYLILLLLISCTKVSNRALPLIKNEGPTISTLEEGFEEFDEKIDVMVAFLWPLKVTGDSQREAMRKVISSSRKLKTEQEVFNLKKRELKVKYQTENCECVLNGLCEDDEIPEDTGICYEIEEEIFEHDRKLVQIFELIDDIETNVKASGGDWLTTHVDFPELPPSTFSFNSFELNLAVLDGEAYSALLMKAFQETLYKRLNVSFKRTNFPGTWEIDVGYKKSPHAVSFQGDLYYYEGPVKREGVIYWENLKK